MPLPVQEPHEQREHQEAATAAAVGTAVPPRVGRVAAAAADGRVRVEEEAQQLEVLHEAHAQLSFGSQSNCWTFEILTL